MKLANQRPTKVSVAKGRAIKQESNETNSGNGVGDGVIGPTLLTSRRLRMLFALVHLKRLRQSRPLTRLESVSSMGFGVTQRAISQDADENTNN